MIMNREARSFEENADWQGGLLTGGPLTSCSLCSDRNRRYTHHPTLLIAEAQKWKRFAHVDWSLVSKAAAIAITIGQRSYNETVWDSLGSYLSHCEAPRYKGWMTEYPSMFTIKPQNPSYEYLTNSPPYADPDDFLNELGFAFGWTCRTCPMVHRFQKADHFLVESLRDDCDWPRPYNPICEECYASLEEHTRSHMTSRGPHLHKREDYMRDAQLICLDWLRCRLEAAALAKLPADHRKLLGMKAIKKRKRAS